MGLWPYGRACCAPCERLVCGGVVAWSGVLGSCSFGDLGDVNTKDDHVVSSGFSRLSLQNYTHSRTHARTCGFPVSFSRHVVRPVAESTRRVRVPPRVLPNVLRRDVRGYLRERFQGLERSEVLPTREKLMAIHKFAVGVFRTCPVRVGGYVVLRDGVLAPRARSAALGGRARRDAAWCIARFIVFSSYL